MKAQRLGLGGGGGGVFWMLTQRESHTDLCCSKQQGGGADLVCGGTQRTFFIKPAWIAVSINEEEVCILEGCCMMFGHAAWPRISEFGTPQDQPGRALLLRRHGKRTFFVRRGAAYAIWCSTETTPYSTPHRCTALQLPVYTEI